MKIQSIRLKNFKMFRDVVIRDLPPLAVFVGANGSGKSTLFDVFGFLRDALTENVEAALRARDRGGFREMRTRGEAGPITIELKFRMKVADRERTVIYAIVIDQDKSGAPLIEEETMSYKRGSWGRPFKVLDFKRGKGSAVVERGAAALRRQELKGGILGSAERGAAASDDDLERESGLSLDNPRILAIKGLGQFEKFEPANRLRQFIENWHLSDFQIDAARPTPMAGHHERISERGGNLAEVARFLHENHPQTFRKILKKMAKRVPGVSEVTPEVMPDGRVLLKFQDGAWEDPFPVRHVSDGTVKMFAYLALLSAPSPHSLLCVEEPENQLYPTLLGRLLEEFRVYAVSGGGQVFVSTHSPDLLDKARPEEAFWLEKKNGIASVHPARDDETVKGMIDSGDVLGRIWLKGLFGGANP